MVTTKLSSLVEKIQEAYGQTNKTFDKPPTAAVIRRWSMLSYMLYMINGYEKDGKRRNIHMIGPAGTGKTATVLTVCEAAGVQAIYLPAANIDPETLGLPIIVPISEDQVDDGMHKETIEFRLREALLIPGKKVIIIDEKRQSAPGMLSIFMELESEGTISGKVIPDLIGVVVLDNYAGDDYGDLVLEDFAQADRIGTLKVDASSTPWERGLAQSHPDLDLKDLLAWYHRLPLDPRSRELFMPRILDHVLVALENGLNAIYGWPVYPDERMILKSTTGDDILATSLDKIASLVGLSNPPVRPDDFKRALRLAITKGVDIIAYSDPGIGKTSLVKQTLKDAGINAAYFSLPTANENEFNYAVPSKDGKTVELIPRGEIWSKLPTIGVYDEVTRGQRPVRNAVNEIVNQHTCGGVALPNYKASIALSNLSTAAGHAMDVDEVTLPFASRFDLSFILDIEDTGALEWLVEKYGDEIVPFVEWYRMDLNDEHRSYVSPRCLERMFDHHQGGVPIEQAIIFLNDEYAPVTGSLALLYARLDGRPVISFLNLVEEVDDYERRLSSIDEDDPTGESDGEMLRMEVYMALMNAEVPTLEKNRDVCVRMIHVIGIHWRYELLKTNSKKWDFWHKALKEAFPDIA
jgi:MoxR-like ATPase